jgi:steroid delta-isomerase-like uncharacterized protein
MKALVLAAALFACGKSANKTSGETGSAAPAAIKPPEPPPKPAYTTPEAKLARFTECWAAFDAGKDDVFQKCFASDAQREQVDSVPDLVAQGAEKISDMAKAQRAAFPDLAVTPQLVLVSGDDILAIVHIAGTNTGEVAGQRTTGKKLGMFEAEIATMNKDGAITHDALYVDQPTLFHQLGLLENDSSPKPLPARTTTPQTLITKNAGDEAANKAVIEKNLDAISKKDAKTILAAVADDVELVYHGEKQKYVGKKAYAKWLDDTLKSTKDGFVDVKAMWAAGDYVVVSDVFSGTPTDAAVGKGVEKTKIETHVVQFFQLADGKVKHQEIFVNRLKAAVQLGAVDPDQLMQMLSKAQ